METNDEKFELNINKSNESLKMEHNDLIKLLINNENNLCTFNESMKLIEKINNLK